MPVVELTGVPRTTSVEDMWALCESIGEVLSLDFHFDRENGLALVTFASDSEALTVADVTVNCTRSTGDRLKGFHVRYIYGFLLDYTSMDDDQAKYVASRKAATYYDCDPRTLVNWADKGLVPFRLTPGGQRRYAIPVNDAPRKKEADNTKAKYCYCRVSTQKQRADLSRQQDAMRAEYPGHKLVSDIGSGLNFKRPGLLAILESAMRGEVEEIVVAHRDRLARFSIELIEWILRKHGVRLVVQHASLDSSPEAELVEDLLAVVTVFACRTHGRRSHKKRKAGEAVPDTTTCAGAEALGGVLQGAVQHGGGSLHRDEDIQLLQSQANIDQRRNCAGPPQVPSGRHEEVRSEGRDTGVCHKLCQEEEELGAQLPSEVQDQETLNQGPQAGGRKDGRQDRGRPAKACRGRRKATPARA